MVSAPIGQSSTVLPAAKVSRVPQDLSFHSITLATCGVAIIPSLCAPLFGLISVATTSRFQPMHLPTALLSSKLIVRVSGNTSSLSPSSHPLATLQAPAASRFQNPPRRSRLLQMDRRHTSRLNLWPTLLSINTPYVAGPASVTLFMVS